MSLDSIKTALKSKLNVAGVARVYDDTPPLSPAAADCPAVIMARRRPTLTVATPYNGTTRYVWHFQILFLYSPLGLDTPDAWDAGIEGYPKKFIDALFSGMTLSGTALVAAQDAINFDIGATPYNGNQYFGFTIDLDVLEDVTATMTA